MAAKIKLLTRLKADFKKEVMSEAKEIAVQLHKQFVKVLTLKQTKAQIGEIIKYKDRMNYAFSNFFERRFLFLDNEYFHKAKKKGLVWVKSAKVKKSKLKVHNPDPFGLDEKVETVDKVLKFPGKK